MSLTGNAFFVLLVVATVVAVAGTLLLWNSVRGPQAVRLLARLFLIGLCQLTAISVVATWINNANGLYTSWADLFGEQQGVGPATADAAQTVFTRGTGATRETTFHGRWSGVTGQVIVWTPPQYSEPKFARDSFPVLMLLHGVPGSPESWIHAGGVLSALDRMMTSGEVGPAIVVIPAIDAGGRDTDCSDTPKARNATWLMKDVRSLVTTRFRALSGPHDWSAVGFSTGGLCAVKLAMQYPQELGSAVGMSPDDFHGDRSALPEARLRELNSPLWLAKRRPPVSLFVATSAKDRFSTVANVKALEKAVQWPTVLSTPMILGDGGHNWGTWRGLYQIVFPWATDHLEPPHAPRPAPGASGPSSRPSALASAGRIRTPLHR